MISFGSVLGKPITFNRCCKAFHAGLSWPLTAGLQKNLLSRQFVKLSNHYPCFPSQESLTINACHTTRNSLRKMVARWPKWNLLPVIVVFLFTRSLYSWLRIWTILLKDHQIHNWTLSQSKIYMFFMLLNPVRIYSSPRLRQVRWFIILTVQMFWGVATYTTILYEELGPY